MLHQLLERIFETYFEILQLITLNIKQQEKKHKII